jgi:hypothetical protein
MGNKHSVYRSTAEMVYICHDVLNRIAFIVTAQIGPFFVSDATSLTSYLLQKFRNWQHYCRHAGNPRHKMGYVVQWL